MLKEMRNKLIEN